MPGRLGGEINDTNTFHFTLLQWTDLLWESFDWIWFDLIQLQCRLQVVLEAWLCVAWSAPPSMVQCLTLNYRILCDELERSFAIRCLKQVLNDRPITHRPSSQITITIQAASLRQGNGNGESSGHHVQTTLVFESLIVVIYHNRFFSQK